MIQSTRVRILNDAAPRPGKYVLYWMQASQRTRFNHALEYAVRQANALDLPTVVAFGLMDDYPEANARHYAFLLEGLRDVGVGLRERGILFVVKRGAPARVALGLAEAAAMIVCDRGYLRHQKQWRDEVADNAACRVVEVESDVVVPVEVASDHAEFAARTLRPKLVKRLDEYLAAVRRSPVKHPSLRLKIEGDIDASDPKSAMARLKVDRSIAPSKRFEGGEVWAQAAISSFLKNRLSGYGEERNEPAAAHTSMLSAYLHFGQISALDIALAVRRQHDAPADDREVYIEELIVRRELAVNFVNYTPNYDDFDCLPNWCRTTLAKHANDRRPEIYTRQELESEQTADPWWNAAQREMNRTGFMHNYMRMYWGKKILEWSVTPRDAYDTTLYLNNKLFLCGRDSNAFANVGWIFGLHDRPWGERKIFGTVRYMNAAGLRRKFDMEAYVKAVAAM